MVKLTKLMCSSQHACNILNLCLSIHILGGDSWRVINSSNDWTDNICSRKNDGNADFQITSMFVIMSYMNVRKASKYNNTVDGIVVVIRPSVDGLCRDGPSEISRDPSTKRLQTRPKRLGWL